MRRRIRSRSIAFFFGLAAATSFAVSRSPADTHGGGNKERRFFSARQGVGVDAPPGWSVSLHTGYANLLCALVHPSGSRISLAVDRTAAKDAAALVEESRPGLVAQGLTIDRAAPGPRGSVQVDARAGRRDQAIRQVYLVRDIDAGRGERQAIVLTLSARADQLAAAAGPFEWVVTHLALETPTRLDDKPDGGR